MPTVDELYSKVSDIFEEGEFREEIEGRSEHYNGLFDDETIARLILAEEGRDENYRTDIADLEPGKEASISGEVVDLGDLRTFDRDNGEGKVRNVRIDDGTGSIKLVLWDDKTDLVGDEIELGSQIQIFNGYIQDKGYGLQVQPGKWGEMKVDEKSEKD